MAAIQLKPSTSGKFETYTVADHQFVFDYLNEMSRALLEGAMNPKEQSGYFFIAIKAEKDIDNIQALIKKWVSIGESQPAKK